ncbi:hypothetical protein JRO89_XS10G0181200 [Xanthoceras sorbifolium]|uniref:ARM repeat superfamily protein n=1 Tax=Xanthoceras sorbifolium TaxID=99658 RepID=A0ABQ8HJD3_9ROSI|nr:hypothetical protein JRO89_XS10G0181200 [Xanthoceras sorbifolium]
MILSVIIPVEANELCIFTHFRNENDGMGNVSVFMKGTGSVVDKFKCLCMIFKFFIMQLFDISTTVDPSYIISLIRKLLPAHLKNGHNGLGDCDATREEWKIDNMEESATSLSKDRVSSSLNHDSEAMDIVDGFDKSSCQGGEGEDSYSKLEKPGVSAGEEAWEEYGCILWDLAASRDHAELMVQNLVLDVLLANLTVSQSVRVMEISLGIIGNLACHEVLMKHIVSTNGLIGTIVDQLFLDDTQCLIEACRLLTSGLQSSECIVWADALKSEHILHRILWITENTLNSQLIEKSAGLILAILEGKQEVVHILLPPLMELGLSSLLVNLLAFEMSKLTSERIPERYPAIDVIFRAIEALSVVDGYSQEICSSKQLLHLGCDLVKFPDKVEIQMSKQLISFGAVSFVMQLDCVPYLMAVYFVTVANSCVTAGVVIANILSDAADLASEISQDLSFLQGLFDIFPFASDDLEARSALWNIVARLLVQVREGEMSPSSLDQFVSILVSKLDMIEDDLLDHQLDDSSQQDKSLTPGRTKPDARTTALRRMISILHKWTTSKDFAEGNDAVEDHHKKNVNVGRLLDCCHKYIKFNAKSCSMD